MRIATSAASLLVVVLVAAAPSVRADFTEADFAGSYAFSAQAGESSGRGSIELLGTSGLTLVGVLSADGRGTVTGARTQLRNMYTGTGPVPVLDARSRSVEQSFEGTYTVEPNGRGVMLITVTPNPAWPIGSGWLAQPDATEMWEFVVHEGGRHLAMQTGLRQTLSGGLRHDLQVAGRAESQAPAQDDAALTAELATVKAQLCEVLRLLNTPEGRRETDAPEVIEACGRSYEWAEHGSFSRPRP